MPPPHRWWLRVSKNMKRGKSLARSQLHSDFSPAHISPLEPVPLPASAVDLGATAGEKPCGDHQRVPPTRWAHQDLISLAESSQPDAGIHLLLWMRKLRLRRCQLVLGSPPAKKPGF